MTPYEIATFFLGFILAALGWWNKMIWTKLDKLPDLYARRDDVKDIENKILAAIGDLSNKLDNFILRKHD